MKHLLTLTFVIFSFSVLAQIDTTEKQFKLPLYPFCDYLEDYVERRICADNAMNNFVKNNFKIPEFAIKYGIEGMVIISFKVGKDGSLSNFKVVGEPSTALGEEIIRVMKLLPNFTPATMNEIPIECEVSLPFRVRLP